MVAAARPARNIASSGVCDCLSQSCSTSSLSHYLPTLLVIVIEISLYITSERDACALAAGKGCSQAAAMENGRGARGKPSTPIPPASPSSRSRAPRASSIFSAVIESAGNGSRRTGVSRSRSTFLERPVGFGCEGRVPHYLPRSRASLTCACLCRVCWLSSGWDGVSWVSYD